MLYESRNCKKTVSNLHPTDFILLASCKASSTFQNLAIKAMIVVEVIMLVE